MKVRLIAIGTRMPRWVIDGVAEYQPRLPRAWRFELVEIPVAARGAGTDVARLKATEGDKLLRAAGSAAEIIAFDERGELLTTAQWADAIGGWERGGRDIALVVGGPDGLADTCLTRAARRWSLSRLTLPHGLVRVMVVEQLYRAASLRAGHPYHRP